MNNKLEIGTSIGMKCFTDFNDIAITGKVGCGKTRFLKNCILQVPSKFSGRCIVFDLFNEYSENLDEHPMWETDNIDIVYTKDKSLHINPFIPIYAEESYESIAGRVASMIRDYLKLKYTQMDYLYGCILNGLNQGKMSNILDLINMIENSKENHKHKNLILQLKYCMNNYFNGDKNINWNLDTPGITVIKFNLNLGFGTINPITIHLLLNSIQAACIYRNDKSIPIVMVFDDYYKYYSCKKCINAFFNNYKLLKVYGWFSSHTLSDFNKEDNFINRCTRIYFCLDYDSIAKASRNYNSNDKKLIRSASNFTRSEFIYHNGRRFVTSRTL